MNRCLHTNHNVNLQQCLAVNCRTRTCDRAFLALASREPNPQNLDYIALAHLSSVVSVNLMVRH